MQNVNACAKKMHFLLLTSDKENKLCEKMFFCGCSCVFMQGQVVFVELDMGHQVDVAYTFLEQWKILESVQREIAVRNFDDFGDAVLHCLNYPFFIWRYIIH